MKRYLTIIVLTISTIFPTLSFSFFVQPKPLSNLLKTDENIWDSVVKSFSLNHYPKKQQVQRFIGSYGNHKYNIKQLTSKSEPYLHYILQELKARNMPSELIFLPMIESAYNTKAISSRGALGLWQISEVAAKRYKLPAVDNYNGRLDIVAATAVALDYLEFLYKEMDNDWLLALAAYNSGEGRVKQAIKKNKALNKDCDFWSLKLPQQTQDFVPKILALSHLIANPDIYQIELKNIEDKPYFKAVEVNSMGVIYAAKLADMPIEKFKTLNSGYHNYISHPYGKQSILLPEQHVEIFNKNLIASQNKNYVNNKNIHKVSSGETLGSIANLYNITINELKNNNYLSSDLIIIGTILKIPKKNKSPNLI